LVQVHVIPQGRLYSDLKSGISQSNVCVCVSRTHKGRTAIRLCTVGVHSSTQGEEGTFVAALEASSKGCPHVATHPPTTCKSWCAAHVLLNMPIHSISTDERVGRNFLADCMHGRQTQGPSLAGRSNARGRGSRKRVFSFQKHFTTDKIKSRVTRYLLHPTSTLGLLHGGFLLGRQLHVFLKVVKITIR
jgi:hypothetical protein